MAKFKRFVKRYKKRGDTQGAIALKMVKRLAYRLKPETKVWDATNNVTVSNTGSVTELVNPAQGDNYINREGIVILPKTLFFRAQIEMAVAAASTFLRVILFRGRNENGGTYGVTDVLQQATMDSPYTWLDRSNYKIMYDRTFNLNDSKTQGMMLVKRFKLSKKRLSFTGSGTGVQDGGVYMLLLSNEPTNTPTVDWFTRATFTDI